MIPPYPVSLKLFDHRGRAYYVPGTVTVDHGPAHEYRYLVVATDYEDFGTRIRSAPGCQFVTWASADELVRAEQEAA